MSTIWDVRQRLIDIGVEQRKQSEHINSIKCLVKDIECHIDHMEKIIKQLYSQIIGEDLAITFNQTIPDAESKASVDASASVQAVTPAQPETPVVPVTP